jgi:tripartite-type tricarboxylate transporter receptor subunit TctC
MAMPTVREKLSKLGATPLNPSPTAFIERVQADRKAWDPVLKTLDLRPN